jgi:hypothetical protein
MRFKVTNSPVESMNGEYEVYQYGLVKNLTEDRLLKPSIDRVVEWMCDDGGFSESEGEKCGLIWIGRGCWLLNPWNEKQIMNALGFGDWPYCVLGEVEDE